jgi:hypothetical protein
VFVNCPYDAEYLPLLQAMVFTVHACGLVARLGMLEVGSQHLRLDTLVQLIASCRFGIHDLSRVPRPGDDALPRFNMPFELGVSYGVFRLGPARCRQMRLLVLEAEPFRHQRTLSDLAGVDPKAHGNSEETLIRCVRDFLAAHLKPRPVGAARIRGLYDAFRAELPALAKAHGLTMDEIAPLDGFPDWYAIAAAWLRRKASGG